MAVIGLLFSSLVPNLRTRPTAAILPSRRNSSSLLASSSSSSSNLLSFLLSFFLVLTFGPTPVAAQASLGNLSSCGLTCLLGGVSRSSCSATDVACQCRSTALAEAVAGCLIANCTMQDSLDVSRFEAAECNFSHASRSGQIVVIMSVLWSVSALFVLLRVVSKTMLRTFCAEDYIIIASIVLAAVVFACALRMARLGLGSHTWDLADGALSQILKLFYISEIIYVAALAMTKTSIISMYLRIFEPTRRFRLACHAALLFVLLPSTAILLATIFSCQPVAYFWDRDPLLVPAGRCLDVVALAYANSGLAVAQDFILIVLPVYMLWRLNMSRRRKVLIALMFAVGGLGLVATIIRLRTLYVFGSLQDPTWEYVPVVYWTTVELAAGILCSCLPALRIMLEKMFGNVFHLGSGDRSEDDAHGIRMERRRRPTVVAPRDDDDGDDDEEEEDGWKGGGWEEDWASQRRLKMTKDDEGQATKSSSVNESLGDAPTETRHDPHPGPDPGQSTGAGYSGVKE